MGEGIVRAYERKKEWEAVSGTQLDTKIGCNQLELSPNDQMAQKEWKVIHSWSIPPRKRRRGRNKSTQSQERRGIRSTHHRPFRHSEEKNIFLSSLIESHKIFFRHHLPSMIPLNSSPEMIKPARNGCTHPPIPDTAEPCTKCTMLFFLLAGAELGSYFDTRSLARRSIIWFYWLVHIWDEAREWKELGLAVIEGSGNDIFYFILNAANDK